MANYTPEYPYDELGTQFNAQWLSTLNENFDDVESDIRALLAYADASLSEIRADIAAWKADISQIVEDFKTYVNGELEAVREDFDTLKTYVEDKVTEFENLTGFVVWKAPVETYSDLRTTYSNAERGWTVQTLDDNRVYYFDGLAWQWALQYGVGNFNPYVFIEPEELKTQIDTIAARGA